MAPPRLSPVTLENRRIIFRNFAGAEGRFNPKGKRNFNVVLDDAEAEAMLADGWNVKFLEPREEGDPRIPRLEVTVHYSERAQPPRVVLITSRGKTPLDESMLEILDWVEVENVDMILRPYEWEVNGKTGVKAYLKALYLTMVEDDLELKYQDVPDSAVSALPVSPEPEMIRAASEILSIERGDSQETPF